MKSLKHPCVQTSPDCVDVSEEETNHCQTSIASCKNIVLADLTERGLVPYIILHLSRRKPLSISSIDFVF